MGVVVAESDSLDTLAVTSYHNSMEELKDASVDDG